MLESSQHPTKNDVRIRKENIIRKGACISGRSSQRRDVPLCRREGAQPCAAQPSYGSRVVPTCNTSFLLAKRRLATYKICLDYRSGAFRPITTVKNRYPCSLVLCVMALATRRDCDQSILSSDLTALIDLTEGAVAFIEIPSYACLLA